MKDHFDSANEFWQTAPSFMRLLLSLSLCLTVTTYTQGYILLIHHQLLQYMSCGYDSDEGDEDDQPPASAHYGRSVFGTLSEQQQSWIYAQRTTNASTNYTVGALCNSCKIHDGMLKILFISISSLLR